MVIPIKHKSDWELIRQKKLTQINKDNICKNRKRVIHEYKVGDKAMLNIKYVFKYDTPYKGPFEIIQCCVNDTIVLQMGATKIRYYIRRIKPCKY